MLIYSIRCLNGMQVRKNIFCNILAFSCVLLNIGWIVEEFDIDKVIEKARLLDDGAMASIYRHYHPKILKFIYYRAKAENVEDLACDVFVKVLRSIGTQKGNFEAWLYKIARNVIIDKARYAGSRPEVPLDPEYAESVPDDNDVNSAIDGAMDIQYALSTLSDEYREFLVLKFIQGLDNKEISEITGKSVGSLRVLQCRALKTMSEVGKEGEV